MCLAVPAKVITVKDTLAEIELSGNRMNVDVSLVPEVKPGDYVIVHAGLAIQRYDEEEARKTLELFRELSDSRGEK
jgi:hydrogenase expression/formation protein HypC